MESLTNPKVRRNRKTRDGEAISLSFDGVPDAFFVGGHVTLEEFNEACDAQYEDDWKEYKLGEIQHVYARWSCEYPVSNDLQCQVLRDYAKPAPRRFPVTMRKVVGVNK